MASGAPGRRPVRAVVFSGGGARGAYEAGVLWYLLDELPKRLGATPRFDIVCGTSVGAIHACFVAATAHEGPGRGRRLTETWKGFRLDEVLPFSATDLLFLPRRLLGLRKVASELRSGRAPERLYGLLNTQALEKIVQSAIPWRSIHRNVVEGRLDAVCVAATQIATGRVVVFIENRERRVLRWTRDRSIVARPARLLPVHALASAAIPVLFPAVRLGSTYYADGGLRLNTPLAPAVRLGADRVLVVGLRHPTSDAEDAAHAEQRVEAYGNPAFLFGKVLNALLLDHVDADLARMRLMNEILRDGEKAFGPEFIDRINAVAERERGHVFKEIDALVIQPSADLGVLAGQVLGTKREQGSLSPLLRFFLRTLGSAGTSFEGDLLSYLLFDADYASPVVQLGFADARAREAELVRFFSDDSRHGGAA